MEHLVKSDDIYRLHFVSSPCISAKGDTFIYVKKYADKNKNTYYSNLNMLVKGSKHPINLTHGETVDTSPVLHPDGRNLFFLRHVEGRTELRQIYLKGGESKLRFTFPHGDCLKMSLSPDGKYFSFLFAEKKEIIPVKDGKSKEPVCREIDNLFYRLDGHGFRDENSAQIYLMKSTGSSFKKLTDAPYDVSHFSWSPDSQRIVYTSIDQENPEVHLEEDDIFITDIKNQKVVKLTKQAGPVSWVVFTPDNENLIFSGHFNPNHSWGADNSAIHHLNLKDGIITALSDSLDRTTDMLTLGDITPSFVEQSPVFSGDIMYFTISKNGANPLMSLNLKSGEIDTVLEGKECVVDYCASQSADKFMLHMARPDKPDEMWLFENSDTKKLTRITFENDKYMEKIESPIPEEVMIPVDDVSIQAFILYPPEFDADKTYPLILNIHGGPRTQYGFTWFHEMQVFAARGYVVLYTNPRGSQGFGKEFADAITGKWGEPAMTDVMAAVDFVVERGYIDENRLYVTGGSYGGYLTNWIVGQTKRFRAAATQRSISDLGTFFGTSDIGWDLLNEFKTYPWIDPEPYEKWSPLTYINNMETPLLFIHSENDLRCPMEQAERLYAPLKYMGKDVKFARFPESSHGLSRSGRPDRRIKRLDLILEWFDSHA